ncbi:hypothetical protein BP6252_00074 [Coleophoma cylindrospora]|uniref:DUF521 domain protein n=1 Tax=Coleophoma cylindrospora TaxID=1849047 RepID=A0A3D8SP34_9HELO|nr:hypothetical protein BP6252_00074 [Coleophoma cylindrospora]
MSPAPSTINPATTITGTAYISSSASGPVLSSSTPLSFWGGVSPATSQILDAHHPLLGQQLAGRVLAIPSSRGSCSGSGVLLELLLNGHAPAALVFELQEEILTLGVLVAREVFGKSIPVLRVGRGEFERVCRSAWVRVVGERVECYDARPEDGLEFAVGVETGSVPEAETLSGMSLSEDDLRLFQGQYGKAAQVAMRIILQMAKVQGADSLLSVTRAHIDGCVYTGPATLAFANQLKDWDAQVRIPTTLNSVSVDLARWRAQGVDEEFGIAASALASAYVAMGVKPTYTCAPYLLDDVPLPRKGEQIMWAESNAVVFANSVLGARTVKCPDYLDICVALTGRAPNAGCHIAVNRRAGIKIILDFPSLAKRDESFFPLLGYLVGEAAGNRIPIVFGLEKLSVSQDDMKAFGAAFATTSSAAMFHLAGLTPEASTDEEISSHLSCVNSTATITTDDLRRGWETLNNTAIEKIDLISLGNPHFSLAEIRLFTTLLTRSETTKHPEITLIITTSRATYSRAGEEGLIETLENWGVQILTDTCWCMISEPVIPLDAKTVLTNSGKYAHYAPGLTAGRGVRFAGLGDCARAAGEGVLVVGLPGWLA